MKVAITFRNGVTINFHAETVTKVKNSVTNELTEISWKNSDDKPSLFFLRIDEILAIVTEEED